MDEPEQRFERLFRRHHAAVVAYVRRRAPDEAVDDVVGETFLVAWRRLDRVPAEELPWLLGVARNVLATQRRSAALRHALTLRLGRGAQSGDVAGRLAGQVAAEPELPAADAVDARLWAALARLSPKNREALTLIAWDGLGPQEAARVLGEPAGAFRVRLHRARRRLRKLLEARPEPMLGATEHRLRIEEITHD